MKKTLLKKVSKITEVEAKKSEVLNVELGAMQNFDDAFNGLSERSKELKADVVDLNRAAVIAESSAKVFRTSWAIVVKQYRDIKAASDDLGVPVPKSVEKRMAAGQKALKSAQKVEKEAGSINIKL